MQRFLCESLMLWLANFSSCKTPFGDSSTMTTELMKTPVTD
jgi:hypothetical protein